MKEFGHVSRLARVLRRALPRKRRALIAIDGIDGSGKTTLAIGLAERLSATVVSADRYLNRHRGSYVRNLRWRQLRQAIVRQSGTVIVEGVCVRAFLSRLRLRAFRHVYVKAISEHGIWSDQYECEIEEPIETFLIREQESVRVMRDFLNGGTSDSTDDDRLLPFREEVLRYHASFSPSTRANFVFLRGAVMPNNALQRTRRKRRAAELGRWAA